MANKKLLGLALGIIAVGILLIFLAANSAESGDDATSDESSIQLARGITSRQSATYIGSDNCSYCHIDIWSNWTNTTHSRKIYNRSVAENASIPLPDGIKWDNVTYVIGFKWKIRYMNETGHIMTFSGENQTVAGLNMWDVAEEKWEDYHPGEELKPYDCGKCHTTGWTADSDAETDGTLADNQDGLFGIWGTWNETGVGCEACHGPGSHHEIDNASTNITLDYTSDNCGYCHQRAYNGNITEVNPDRKHHEQYNDWSVSKHSESNVECINCHNPHDTSHSQYNMSNFMNYNTAFYSDIKPAKIAFFNGTDNNITTVDYLPVAGSEELCGKCHDSRVQDLDHGDGTVDATCVDCHMAPSRKTINKWDIRSHTFKVNDNIVYTADPPNNFPNLTCQQSPCHTEGLEHYEDWKDSAHADTFHGYNGNTYCAHCMSPFNYEEMYNATNATSEEDNMPVSKENWTSVACSACHNLHEDPEELSFFNGSDYNPIEDISRDLCGACHSGERHTETADWNSSKHANSYHGYNDNTYCAHCMSPFESDSDATEEDNDLVGAGNWTSVGCIVCHDRHSLELVIFDGEEYQEIDDISRDLCGVCHSGERHTETADWNSSKHASSFHGYNNNTYCAHCMSPYQGDPEATEEDNDPVTGKNWTSVGCIVCHDKHSLELVFYNGSAYEDVEDISVDLCGACHQGERHTETVDWKSSAHSNTYHGYNGNTYCAHCMSPYQGDQEANETKNKPVSAANWTSVGCIVCHDKHSLELAFFNGSAYEEVEDISLDLCGACHQGERHKETEEWKDSAHASSFHGYNNNTYCAHCMSPYQGDPEANDTVNEPVTASNWTSVGCIVCHDEHTLELAFFNGTAREDPVTNPADLCGACHTGPRHTETVDWSSSVHATTGVMDKGNNNTFCARCHSPFQADSEATFASNMGIAPGKGTGITCTVCHQPHSLELVFYNGSAYEEIDDVNILCSKCHRGTGEFEGAPFVINIYDQWKASGHASTYKGFNDNTYCAHCMSPFEAGAEDNWDTSTKVGAANWSSIGCMVCHDKHSLELALYNGSAYVETKDTNELCGACHSMTVSNGEPKHPQIEMRTGTDALNVSSSTFMVGTKCADCHGFDSNHSFHFEPAACVECHKSTYTNETAQEKVDDYQDDFTELHGYVEVNKTKAEFFKDNAVKAGTWNTTLNDTFYRGIFNFYFANDGSSGVHNPVYAKDALEQANDDFNFIIKEVQFLPPITVSPADDSEDISINTVVTVKFEKDINFNSFQENSSLSVNGVTGTLTYDNTTFTVTFTPEEALDYETTYTATLTQDVVYADDLMIIIEDYSWSFTTEEEVIIPQNVIVKIGPIKDDEGNPIKNAEVTVIFNGTPYNGFTNDQGIAELTIPVKDYSEGEIDIKVTRDDFKDLEFKGTVGADGTFTPPAGGIPEMVASEKETGGDDNTMMLIIAIIVIIIIIILIAALATRGKKKPEEEEKEAEEEEEEGAEEEEKVMECEECGAEVPPGDTECPDCGAEIELPEDEEELDEDELPEGEEEVDADAEEGEEEEPLEEGEEPLEDEELEEEELEEELPDEGEELPEGEDELEEGEELTEGDEELLDETEEEESLEEGEVEEEEKIE